MSVSALVTKLSRNTNNILFISTFDSPVGKTIVAADDSYLYMVCFEDAKNLHTVFETLSSKATCKFVEDKNKILQKFQDELTKYFAGKLKKFNVPIKLLGSEFQKVVWHQLLSIPFGCTQTYGDIAKALGKPASYSRAVGSACSANPIPIVVPCHRVIASSAKKGGYSCGIDRKIRLLEHEQKYVNI